MLLKVVSEALLVYADETSQIYLEKPHKDQPGKDLTHMGYTWVFASRSLVVYVFSRSRRGEVAESVLKGTEGYLVADAYAGYNCVLGNGMRIHVACMAHARRKFKVSRSGRHIGRCSKAVANASRTMLS